MNGVFVTVAGAGVAEAGTGVAEAGTDMVVDKAALLKAANFRPIAKVSCVLRRVWDGCGDGKSRR